jgi:hypothetical protein
MAKSKESKSLGKEIYDDAGEFGKIMSIIGVIVGTLLGAVLIFGGAMAVRSKSVLTETVVGKITNDPSCSVIKESDGGDHVNCIDIEIEYEIDGETYQIVETSSGINTYIKDEDVTLYYDPTDPSGARLQSDNVHAIGWVLISVGVIILILAWSWYFITRASKFASVVGGAGATAQILRSV